MRSESLKTFRPAYWTGQERDRNRKGERKAETSRARDRLVLFMPCILPPSSSPVPPSYSWYPLCLPGLFLVEAHKFAQTTRHSAATWSKLIRRLAAGNGAHWQATNKTNRKASTMSLSSLLCPVSYVPLLFLIYIPMFCPMLLFHTFLLLLLLSDLSSSLCISFPAWGNFSYFIVATLSTLRLFFFFYFSFLL